MILPFSSESERNAVLPAVTEHLRANGLIAYPTETVYGFGCLLRPAALRALAQLKGGRDAKQFLVLLRGIAQAGGLEWTAPARALAGQFWPGPLTLVLKAPAGSYPADVTRPDGGVAVRVSPHPAVHAILDAVSEPLTSTSANLPGSPPATSAQQVAEILSALADSTTLVLDGGTLASRASSTIVDCMVAPPRVLRAGAIATADIEHCLHDLRA